MTQERAKDAKDDFNAEHLESLAYTKFSEGEAPILREYDGSKGKKVIRKIDAHLLPVLAFLYLCSHVDRNNLGNAKIEGMNTDLGLLIDHAFIADCRLSEFPSNVMLKKTDPSYWLASQVVTWGIVMTCMGAVQEFASLTGCRVLLRVFEITYSPDFFYLDN
ncbi:MFS transporter [Penicillium waksmanii]|uniref:MFS transporter n=1 Tax=Penicillium waksmanii TaxID=69791 RepID=UPI002547BC08|nr:MFS transporter [Penicillium waksmanii]KAJ5983728.1 MFS transporter [Penicillium waksmanii]